MEKSIKYIGLYKQISDINSNFQCFQQSNIMHIPYTKNKISHINKVSTKFHILDSSVNKNSIYLKKSNILYIFGYLETEIEYTSISFEENIHRISFREYISRYIRLHNNVYIYTCIFPKVEIYDTYCNLLKNNTIYNNVLLVISIL